MQNGDVLLLKINDTLISNAVPITTSQLSTTLNNASSMATTNLTEEVNLPEVSVYQATRPGHTVCDISEGVLLDTTPLNVEGLKIVTLYDKDLSDGLNFLIGK